MEMQRKVIGAHLQKGATRTENGHLLVRGKFTSDNKDEVGDIITRAATERAVPKYRQWGNIRRLHLPEPVGRVEGIGVEDGLEWNEVEIRVIDPKAIFEVENGLLQALSVGILINFSDIDFLEDGGWIINDYTLAEISLVDHPANYDAKLDTSKITPEARAKVREMGLIPAMRSLGMLLENKTMSESTAESVQVAVEETLAPEVNAEVVSQERDITAVENTEGIDGAPVAEAPAVEAVDSPAPDFKSLFQEAMVELTASILAALKEELKNLIPAQPVAEPAVEATSEVVEAAEVPVADPERDVVRALEDQVKALQAQVDELSTPADRRGALPNTEVIQPEVVEVENEQPAVEERPKGLRSAVKMFVNANKP